MSAHVTGLATLTEGIPVLVFLGQVRLPCSQDRLGRAEKAGVAGFGEQTNHRGGMQGSQSHAGSGSGWASYGLSTRSRQSRHLCWEALGVPIPTETWLWKSLLVGFPTDNLITKAAARSCSVLFQQLSFLPI